MCPESKGSDAEKIVGKAVVEAAKMSSQASQVAKRILGEVAAEMAEKKGYDVPSIDLVDTYQELVARISMAGVSKDSIDLRVTEDSLSIDAKAEPFEGKFLRREISPLGFKREIKLPLEVKPEQVRASYNNGILEVHLPKVVVVTPTSVRVE